MGLGEVAGAKESISNWCGCSLPIEPLSLLCAVVPGAPLLEAAVSSLVKVPGPRRHFYFG